MAQIEVFYRICPFSNGKSPVFTDDKYRLAEFCLRSYVAAFPMAKTTFILDSCPPEYHRLVEDYGRIVAEDNMGNIGSYLKQLELTNRLDDEQPAYLAEDDYYYLPQAGRLVVGAINAGGFVTPSDFAEFYQNKIDLSHAPKRNIEGHTFRRVPSSCLTFGGKAKLFKANYQTFVRYGISDYPMWLEVGQRYPLYAPYPTLSTHLVIGLLSPGVDWQRLWSDSL